MFFVKCSKHDDDDCYTVEKFMHPLPPRQQHVAQVPHHLLHAGTSLLGNLTLQRPRQAAKLQQQVAVQKPVAGQWPRVLQPTVLPWRQLGVPIPVVKSVRNVRAG